MKIQTICFLTACTLLVSGCTSEVIVPNTSPSPTPIFLPSPTGTPAQTSSPSPSPTATNGPSARPSTTTKIESKSEVKSYSSSNSTNNVNITSNGTNVKIYTKDGKRYAELNGKSVELDANGCYDYNEGGTKIHSCVNN